ncbi:hypothetical protein JCM19000A_42640 [Silvimonas sp. JCM 19000]
MQLGEPYCVVPQSFTVRKLYTEEGVPACNVEMSLTAHQGEEGYALGIVFLGVTNLKVGNLNGLLASVIDISDISAWGLVGARYKAVDVEAACFSLNCQDFETRLTELA